VTDADVTGTATDHWLQQRPEAWRELEAELPALEDRKRVSYERLRKVLHLYPELARDTAMARRVAPGSRTTAYLESLYRRLHRALYRERRARATDVKRMLRDDVPAITWQLRWQIISIGIGFVLSGLAGWWLVATYPELAALFSSEQMIETVESGQLWTDHLLNITPSSVLSLSILTNNIVVALTAMCLGVLYGLGTVYIIGLNGLMLGGVFAFTAQYGMADELFEFVVAHGCVELSVIVVAGAIGFSIGESLARPGPEGRGASFRMATERGMRLMVVCVVFLVGAGVIEGYVSPDDSFGLGVRVIVGVAYWLLFLFALCGWRLPWRASARNTPARASDPTPQF
jgi:uncharacterized membrane protein SpoIIM required for sporulation